MPALESLIAELTGGDEGGAEAAVPHFAAYGQAAVDALAALFASPHSDHRWWAVRALSTLKENHAGEILRGALQDPDLAVRHCACLALRTRPDPAAIPDLIALLNHQDRLLARLAGDALIAQGEAATKPLIKVVDIGSQAARLEAVRALAAIGDQKSIAVLFNILEGDSNLMRYWAEKGLGDMGIGMMFFNPGG